MEFALALYQKLRLDAHIVAVGRNALRAFLCAIAKNFIHFRNALEPRLIPILVNRAFALPLTPAGATITRTQANNTAAAHQFVLPRVKTAKLMISPDRPNTRAFLAFFDRHRECGRSYLISLTDPVSVTRNSHTLFC